VESVKSHGLALPLVAGFAGWADPTAADVAVDVAVGAAVGAVADALRHGGGDEPAGLACLASAAFCALTRSRTASAFSSPHLTAMSWMGGVGTLSISVITQVTILATSMTCDGVLLHQEAQPTKEATAKVATDRCLSSMCFLVFGFVKFDGLMA